MAAAASSSQMEEDIGAGAAAAAAASPRPSRASARTAMVSTVQPRASTQQSGIPKASRSIEEEIAITNLHQEEDTLTFDMTNVNVSIVNALRRVILTDIPCLAFSTHPYENSPTKILKNTTRLNNEILLQRLSCIPIYGESLIKAGVDINMLEVIINKKNETKEVMYATTEDFMIRNLETGDIMDMEQTRKIFPPDPITNDFILFARLRPQISADILGEEISIQAKLAFSTAGEDGAHNVVSTCSYSYIVDKVKQDAAWGIKERELRAQSYSPEEIAFERQNWLTLDGKRHIEPNGFEFIVETLGEMTNKEIILKACNFLIDGIKGYRMLVEEDKLIIDSAQMVDTGYDLKLNDTDYTFGKLLEYLLYALYYDTADGERLLSFVGFRKNHPHDINSFIRIILNYTNSDVGLVSEGSQRDADLANIKMMFMNACDSGIKVYMEIMRTFERLPDK